MEHSTLICADFHKTVNFFYIGLQTELGEEKVNDDDVKHVASALASFALTSRHSTSGIPLAMNLSEVHDMFVLNQSWAHDLSAQVTAGASIFFHAGFLRGKREGGRYNLNYFENLGQNFYFRASSLSRTVECQRMYGRLAENYSDWTDALFNFHESLRFRRYQIIERRPN